MQNTSSTGNSNFRRRFRGYGELLIGILGLVVGGFDLRAYLQVGQVDTGKHRIVLQGSDAWPWIAAWFLIGTTFIAFGVYRLLRPADRKPSNTSLRTDR